MRYMLSLFSLLLFNFLQAQVITYKDLTYILSKSNWEGVNQYVTSKGWKYNTSAEETDDQYATITWAFRPDRYDDTKAEAWLTLSVEYNKPINVRYQYNSIQVFNSLKASLTAAGMKKVSSDIIDDALTLSYTGKTYSARLSTSKTEGSFSQSTVYVVSLSKQTLNESNGSYSSDDTYTTDTTAVDSAPRNGVVNEYEDDGSYTSFTYTNGKLNGAAKTYSSDGTLLGTFVYKNDLLNGPYKLYEEGQLIESGNYVNNKKQGAYKLYENGRITTSGTFVDEVANGIHTYYSYPEDALSEYPVKTMGVLINNQMNGVWKDYVIIKGRDIQIGFRNFKKDELNGLSKQVLADSIIYATYEDGELNGPYKIYVDYLTPKDSLLIGDSTKAYLSEVGKYEKGYRVGLWKSFDHQKNIRSECNYVNGAKHGVCKTFNPKEGVMIVSSYAEDELQTETFYIINSDQLYSGILRTFSRSLAPKEEIEVKEGKRHGTTKVYNEEGILEFQANYQEGVIQH